MKRLYHLFLFAIQYCFYYLITPIAYLIYKDKYPWIISERGNDARDNGYTMFKYLRENQRHVSSYYLINKKSVDYPKAKELGKVVRYKSLKHWLLYRVAECRMSTHLAAFAPGNYIGEWFKHHKQCGINVFLQHGITHNEFPSNYYEHNGSDLFVCGAKPEYDNISKNCHYPKGNVIYAGFSRFDELHDFKTKDQILVMPTWRSYLQGISKKEFVNSRYFKAYDELLRNNELNRRLEAEGLKLIFYIHYSLQKYSDCFNNYGSNIVVADFNHYDVQALLKESKLLITDYSSVFFDFAYMRKPLLYYQFDENDFYGKHYEKSYFNHEKDGFGNVVNDEKSLVADIISVTNNGFILEPKYLDRINNFFPLYDSNNSKRIFNEILLRTIDSNKPKRISEEPTYVIFSGDDYGRNVESTLGINEAYKKGHIQQTSLMVNRNKEDQQHIDVIPKNKIIFHFNILEGNKMYDPDGEWFYFIEGDTIARRLARKNTFLHINNDDLKIIDEEIDNQINRYLELGYKPIAFDSHGHMHNRLPIAKLLTPKCKKAGFKVARIPDNMSKFHKVYNLTYRNFMVHYYKKRFITADYFCSCYELLHLNLNKYKNKAIEVMTHPFMFDDGVHNRRDIDFQIMKTFISNYNVKLIDYNELILLKEGKEI